MLTLASSRAATITWTNTAGGNWNDAANWNPNQVPGASDDALVNFIQDVVSKKEERHHIGEPDFVPASRTMVHIGG